MFKQSFTAENTPKVPLLQGLPKHWLLLLSAMLTFGCTAEADLEAGKAARLLLPDLDDDAKKLVSKDLSLLTAKPTLYVCNVDEAAIQSGGNAHSEQLKAAVANEQAEVILICAGIEAQIAEMETIEERMEFLEMMDLKEPGKNILIQACYQLLNLITYFTAGEKEVRAWTVPVGATAPQGAGVIHTDFERGFIRCEVYTLSDLETYRSEKEIRSAGKMRTEGKTYVLQDGDICHFLFNV